MQLALPKFDQKTTYQRLATVYTAVFAACALSFYITLIDTGYDTNIALFAATAAALHYALLRLAGSFPVMAPTLELPRFKPASVLADTDLISRLSQLGQEARSSRDEIGLMLITLSSGINDFAPPSPEVLKLVKGELFRAADSRIFQVDERTLAIAEAHRDVVLRFDKISGDLHRLLRGSQQASRDEDQTRAIVGVAVAGNESRPATEFLDNARTAIRLAKANERDTFFRRI